jgi:quinolinate synthase
MASRIQLRLDAEIANNSCSSELKEPSWSLDKPFAKPAYGPGASQWDKAPAETPLQSEIPSRYRQMAADELENRIEAARKTLGEKLVILGHHYQRDDIIKYADLRGDSYKLSQLAAARPQAE